MLYKVQNMKMHNENEIYIFGAHAVAIGISRAVRVLFPEIYLLGFIVSDLTGNPSEIDNLPVKEISELSANLSDDDKHNICLYVATPANLHEDIIKLLERNEFYNYFLIDAETEAKWMEQYYKKCHLFSSLHDLPVGEQKVKLTVYATYSQKDRSLLHPPVFPPYVRRIQLGCANHPDGLMERKVEDYDHTGDNISAYNSNYCEMTGYYWVWKNALKTDDEYVGICHYRRMLELNEEDLTRINRETVDAVLPWPMIHLPDIREHHARYVMESDWEAMLKALRELYPEYADAYQNIFAGEYFYNYNLIIAKKKIFSDYCAWVFPLLQRTGELSDPIAMKRGDRYLAYISESLLTLYFLYHKELKIYHTGRILYT